MVDVRLSVYFEVIGIHKDVKNVRWVRFGEHLELLPIGKYEQSDSLMTANFNYYLTLLKSSL